MAKILGDLVQFFGLIQFLIEVGLGFGQLLLEFELRVNSLLLCQDLQSMLRFLDLEEN
jgi:hypothetical protein